MEMFTFFIYIISLHMVNQTLNFEIMEFDLYGANCIVRVKKGDAVE